MSFSVHPADRSGWSQVGRDGPLAELFGQGDDDPRGAAEVAEPVAVLVLDQLTEQLGAVSAQAGNDVLDVVDGLAAATAFFVALELELEGEATVEGSAVDRLVGLEGVRSDIAMMRTPDGHGRVELTKYQSPPSPDGDPRAPANTLRMHRIMFAVDDIDDILDRLRPHGAELVGELVRYENSYRLCYLRGPAGIIVALAEQIK